LNTVVDTSVWSLSLRRKPEDLSPTERVIVDELVELISEGRVCLIGVVRQEVLSGIRTDAQFERLRSFLRAFQDLDITIEDYEAAAQASNQCQAKGITVSAVDALICAVALNHDWAILTTDNDFKLFTRILSVKLHSPRR
jgi:predicted nucleic acid-binding protein